MLVKFALVALLVISTVEARFTQFVQGGGKQYEAEQHSSGGEKGNSGFIGQYQQEKGAKGQHEKENQRRHYSEEGGNKKGYNHKDGYYSQHHQGENGQKGYDYEDNTSYAKGHSTKGHHKIHKLNEFKKNTDFFDEDNDEGVEERHGGYEVSKGTNSGKFDKGGYSKGAFVNGKWGKKGKIEKGSHNFADKGYKNGQGFDEFFANGAKFGEESSIDRFDSFSLGKSE